MKLKKQQHNIFFCSDHHFGHSSILKFRKDANGEPIFSSLEEMHDFIIEKHNSVVRKSDTVYMLGDIAWNIASLKLVKELKGHKILIMGNHDKQNIKSYYSYFQDCKGMISFSKRETKFVLSHMPVHPQQLEYRYTHNIHGHLHSHNIDNDKYFNVSLEQIKYTPIELNEIKEKLLLR